ncbi:MAG: MBL fold metallo-hydrolase [Pseudomonadota bacterium]
MTARHLLVHLSLLFAALGPTATASDCGVSLIVLGTGQDAGAPQIGNPVDPGWRDPALRLTATALALVDHNLGRRYLFEATPHLTAQLQRLDRVAPTAATGLGIDGIFLTHAHIGHYAGLMFLGREAAGAQGVPVWVLPRFADYLRRNGPWSQLVALENIRIEELAADQARTLPGGIAVTPRLVPHRDEFSETAAYIVRTRERSFLFVPDIDSWQQWTDDHGTELERLLDDVDLAFVDATFFDDNELPGRDMSQIPHPRVVATMQRLQHLPEEQRARLHFIHYNHSNPIRDPGSPESQQVLRRGFRIAREGDRFCLATPAPL